MVYSIGLLKQLFENTSFSFSDVLMGTVWQFDLLIFRHALLVRLPACRDRTEEQGQLAVTSVVDLCADSTHCILTIPYSHFTSVPSLTSNTFLKTCFCGQALRLPPPTFPMPVA